MLLRRDLRERIIRYFLKAAVVYYSATGETPHYRQKTELSKKDGEIPSLDPESHP